jgi:uncharacterized protein (TIGR00251 family)
MPFAAHKNGVTAAVRLTPGAKTEAWHGLMEVEDGKQALKISVRAVPEDGKANEALLAFLADAWGVPRNSLSLLSGATSRRKTVLVTGKTDMLLPQLQNWLGK